MSRAIAELSRDLETVHLGAPHISFDHVSAMQRIIGTDVFGYFSFDLAGALDAFAFTGLSPHALAEYRRRVICVDRTWGFFEPWAVPCAQQNRLVHFQAQQFLRGEPYTLRRLGLRKGAYQRVRRSFEDHCYAFYERFRFDTIWQLRVVITDGAKLVGWVGGLSERRPTRAQVRTLEEILPSVQRRVAHARCVSVGRAASPVIEAVMAAHTNPCFLLTPSGRIVHANRTIDAATRDALREAALRRTSTKYDLIELAGSLLLAIERACTPDLSRFPLTPRQREIALRLCSGACNREIATDLGISERTVEVHLTAIYDRLGVEQRAAAIARLLRG